MSQHDVYAAPRSSVSGPTLSERALDASGAYPLASAGQRIGAALLDFLILLPAVLLAAYLSTLSRAVDIGSLIVYQTVVPVYFVAMVALFGGTPGKRMLDMRVVMLDRSPATWKAAILRYSLYGVSGLILCAGQVIGKLRMSDEVYQSGGYLARAAALQLQTPGWVMPFNFLLLVVVFVSFVMLLATKQRRTLYDFLAGTIVVRTR